MADVRLTAELDAKVADFERDMAGAARAVQQATGKIDVSLANTSKALIANSKASSQASFALVNLGRVASDAPYGFIGIANNLEPVIHGFQALVKESGGVRGALKNLGSSLMGGAGLGLAFSVVVSAIQFASIGLSRWTGSVKDAKKESEDYVKSLDSVHQAMLKGQQDGATEVGRLNLLFSATQNHTLSLKSRNQAYDELMHKYPKYFSNAEREKTLNGQNKEGYEQLATAILAAASAKAYEAKIGDNANKIFELQSRQNDLQKRGVELQREKVKADKEVIRTQELINKASTLNANSDKITQSRGGLQALRAQTGIVNEINSNIAERIRLGREVNKIQEQNQKLSELALASEVKSEFKQNTQLDDKVSKIKAEKQATEDLYATQVRTFPQAAEYINLTADATERNVTAGNKLIATLELQEAFFNRISDAVSGVTDAIGTGLTGAFAQLFQGSAQGFADFGKMIVGLVAKIAAAIVAAYILSAALSAIFPGFALAKGASNLSTLTSAFSGIAGLGGVLGFANGGIVSKPTLAMIGEGREPEIIAPKSDFMDFARTQGGGMENGKIVGVLRGADLLLQFERATKQKGRLG